MSGVNNITISISPFPERQALYQCVKYHCDVIHRLLFIYIAFFVLLSLLGLCIWVCQLFARSYLEEWQNKTLKWDICWNILFYSTIVEGCVGILVGRSFCRELGIFEVCSANTPCAYAKHSHMRFSFSRVWYFFHSIFSDLWSVNQNSLVSIPSN